MMRIQIFLYSLYFIVLMCLVSLTSFSQKKDVYVDKNGVMRWGDTKEEVYGFGVNYTAPFAHAYRSAKKLNVDLKKAIDEDVYHFSRLGFDAFRVHVWDTEISDSVGNLLVNDHLQLFDYMLAKMKARGMKMLLTPIAFWGNGYPEPDEKTPGFSRKYGKDACLTNEDAMKAQENYLFQFVNHVNPYTKLAYKDDPDIIAFEVSNEPHHRGAPKDVTAYINRMVESIQRTGCRKPVFYNISHSVQLEEAYFASKIKGGTFQWYPTGLGARHELRGNFLPNVDKYTMPFTSPKFKSIAKVVYEFDAADVGRSYIYPAMARSFRSAGIQWATHFAYDPTFMAFANTEYNTHYMNLAYAPQKALSLMIASEVFHKVPRYKTFGQFPADTTFDAFHVSYQKDLAEMVTEKKFIYTNDTKTIPPQVQKLENIAGFGHSPVVSYDGRGAYFLDKLEDGVWRLEVMPDAIWVDNIFGHNSLKKTVAVVHYHDWPMRIELPDLGPNFQVTALRRNGDIVEAHAHEISVEPGVYLLVRKGVQSKVKGSDVWKHIRIDEFAAPEESVKQDYVIHQPYTEVDTDRPIVVKASVVAPYDPESVTLQVRSLRGMRSIPMVHTRGYDFEATIPGELVQPGFLEYYIKVTHANRQVSTFPGNVQGDPSDWDFYSKEVYRVAAVPSSNALYLFNAATDADEVSKEWRRGTCLLPGVNPESAMVYLNIEKLFVPDAENLKGNPVFDYALRYNFRDKIQGRKNDLQHYHKLVIKGIAYKKSIPIQVALVDKMGNAFGGFVQLDLVNGDCAIDLSTLRPVKLVNLPRPFPTFLPYYFEALAEGSFNLSDVETLQISVGEGIEDKNEGIQFAIESVRLE